MWSNCFHEQASQFDAKVPMKDLTGFASDATKLLKAKLHIRVQPQEWGRAADLPPRFTRYVAGESMVSWRKTRAK